MNSIWSMGIGRYLGCRVLSQAATQMMTMSIAWTVYERTGSVFNLGLIGLVWFLPSLVLALPAGQAADHFDKRIVVQVALGVQVLAAGAMFFCARASHFSLLQAYVIVVVIGAGRAFATPAFQSLLPEIVEPADLHQAVAAGSSANQIATITGPALAGLIMAWQGAAVFLALTVIQVAAAVLLTGVRLLRVRHRGAPPSPWAGLAYVRTNRILLGAITLDMFTVLFGGVTAILPVFARDILHAGPSGLGLLRSAPAVGAVLVGLGLAHMPLRRRTGPILLWAVAGYGVATIVIGLSTNFLLSLATMTVLGACDMVSVVVRQTLVQVVTPDAMRGRVSAVNSVFIGASNQLGGFESGVVASLVGAGPSAILGGIGAVAVVSAVAYLFPEIRKVDRIERLEASEPSKTSPVQPA